MGRPRSALRDLGERFRAGTTTPVEVAEVALAALAAADRQEPPLRAVIATTADHARAQAEAATARWRGGRPRSPLDGVPIVVKDNLDLAGAPTRNGTRLPFDAPRTAVALERLIDAGAVILGKASMHELGLGTTGVNPAHGTPRNPHAPERWCGGSSSGSACAVAAGLVPLAIGSDAGGSIRAPAAYCGAVGLKPTFGRVSRLGMSVLCDTLDAIGPLAATCADAALGLIAMAGPHPADPDTWDQTPMPSFERLTLELGAGLGGMTIGVARRLLDHPLLDPRLAGRVADAGRALTAAGARLVDVELPDLEHCLSIGLTLLVAEAPSGHEQMLHRQRHKLGADVQVLLALGAAVSARDYLKAQRARNQVRRAYRKLFESVELILLPSVGDVAGVIQADALATGELDQQQTARALSFTMPSALTGNPALSVPAGVVDGLPVGVQLVAPPWHELEALRAGVALEKSGLSVTPRPARWYG